MPVIEIQEDNIIEKEENQDNSEPHLLDNAGDIAII